MEKKELIWNQGPEYGGNGTAGGGMWNDGDFLLVVIELREGRDVMAVRINCVDGYANMVMADTGDDCGWSVEDIAWWANLENALPGQSNAPITNPDKTKEKNEN